MEGESALTKIIELRNVTLGVKRDGSNFILTLEDKKIGEVYWVTLPPHIADELREKLGTVQIAAHLPFER